MNELILRRAKALSDLDKVKNNINSDVGHIWRCQIEFLRSTLKIYMDNVTDVENWSREGNHPKFIMPPEKDRNMEMADLYFQELLRRIHNSLSAMTTYMNQAKVTMDKIASGNDLFSQEYKSKVKDDYLSDPLTNFLKRFRNFICHYKSLDYIVHHHYDWRAGSFDSNFIIDTHNLKMWDGWGKLGSEYLKSTDEKQISIIDQLNDISLKFSSFLDWFCEVMYKYFPEIFIITEKLYKEHERLAEIGYEEQKKNFGNSEDMNLPRFRGHIRHTANLPPR